MKTPKRPVGLMLLAQGICLAATPLTLLTITLRTGMYSEFTFRVDQTLATMLIWVEIEAFCICGRVRKASAFSRKNERALGRIAIALCIAGGLSLFFGNAIIPWLLTGLAILNPIVEWLLLPFILLTLALMVRAVQVLMRRALTMQEESDLTV